MAKTPQDDHVSNMLDWVSWSAAFEPIHNSHEEALGIAKDVTGLDFSKPVSELDLIRAGIGSHGHRWFDSGSLRSYNKSLHFRHWFVNRFSWALPTKEVIELIVKTIQANGIYTINDYYAGLGYWSYLLEQLGGVLCRCFDNESSHMARKTSPWHEIEKQDCDLVENISPDCAVFMSWVPYEGSAEHLLKKMHSGQLLFFITEGRGGCIADDATHNYIDENFVELEGTHPQVLQFWGLHDRLEIYRKK